MNKEYKQAGKAGKAGYYSAYGFIRIERIAYKPSRWELFVNWINGLFA